MAAMEATVATLTDQLNDYSGEIARLLKIIDDNDAGTKQVIQTEITGIQTQVPNRQISGDSVGCPSCGN